MECVDLVLKPNFRFCKSVTRERITLDKAQCTKEVHRYQGDNLLYSDMDSDIKVITYISYLASDLHHMKEKQGCFGPLKTPTILGIQRLTLS